LLLKVPITGTCPAGGLGFGAGTGTVTQPGMRMSNSSDRERKPNLFNVVIPPNIYCLLNGNYRKLNTRDMD
jgi:hypothetical protein